MNRRARVLRQFILAIALVWPAQFAAAQRPDPVEPERPADDGLPTLDDAIHIRSYIDRSEVYLGESILLTLEYWELVYRGVQVQPYYRTGAVELPDTEGFYAGRLKQDQRDATRDGALYSVTVYEQQLYPTTAGTLQIGPWTWKGSVRGYTSGGAQSLSVDLATDPIAVRVRPLPAPPAAFRGAVGEFDIALRFESRDLTRGVPVVLDVEISGTGNARALEVPTMPDEAWFNLNGPEAEVEPAGEDGDTFTKRFRFEFMPVGDGQFTFPPISLTYFSPGDARYKAVRTGAVEIQIAPSGEPETLVVIGGASAVAAGLVLEDGRLPLAASIDSFNVRRSRSIPLAPLIALAPVLFAAAFLARHGLQPVQFWRRWQPAGPSLDARLAAAGRDPRPVDALDRVTREILAERLGLRAAGMTLPEIEAGLAGRIPDAASSAVVDVLQKCQDVRYGKSAGAADMPGLIARARKSLHQVRPQRGRGSGE